MRSKNKIKIFKDHARVYDAKGDFFIVDIEDLDFVRTRYWLVNEFGRPLNKSITKYRPKTMAFFYRELLSAKPGDFVDHIDRNTRNNRRSNLRICTIQQNSFNRAGCRTNKSGIKGVSFWINPQNNRGYWKAQCVAGKKRKITYHKTKEEAADAYARHSKELHGDFFYGGEA